MNEIERAIKFLGYVKGYDIQSANLAIEALREKQERDKGCEYCQSENGQGTDIWHGNQLSVGYGVYRAINYCPMCGKRLEVEHE